MTLALSPLQNGDQLPFFAVYFLHLEHTMSILSSCPVGEVQRQTISLKRSWGSLFVKVQYVL